MERRAGVFFSSTCLHVYLGRLTFHKKGRIFIHWQVTSSFVFILRGLSLSLFMSLIKRNAKKKKEKDHLAESVQYNQYIHIKVNMLLPSIIFRRLFRRSCNCSRKRRQRGKKNERPTMWNAAFDGRERWMDGWMLIELSKICFPCVVVAEILMFWERG